MVRTPTSSGHAHSSSVQRSRISAGTSWTRLATALTSSYKLTRSVLALLRLRRARSAKSSATVAAPVTIHGATSASPATASVSPTPRSTHDGSSTPKLPSPSSAGPPQTADERAYQPTAHSVLLMALYTFPLSLLYH